jgi:hypothetical protein
MTVPTPPAWGRTVGDEPDVEKADSSEWREGPVPRSAEGVVDATAPKTTVENKNIPTSVTIVTTRAVLRG